MLDTIPKPKIPVFKEEDDKEFIPIDEAEEIQEIEVSNSDNLPPDLEESLASILGFICAVGLPEDIFSEKQQFYKEQAINLGVINNFWKTLKTYFPDLEISPAIALIVSLGIFAMIVYSDRKQTLKTYKKLQEQYKIKTKKQITGEKNVQSENVSRNGKNDEQSSNQKSSKGTITKSSND